MDLEPRLAILREGGLLSDENYGRVREIITFLREKHGLDINEDNAAAFITHICAAFERICKGEGIEPIDPEIYEETQQEPTFGRALKISTEIQKLHFILPDEELSYITMHIGVLLANN